MTCAEILREFPYLTMPLVANASSKFRTREASLRCKKGVPVSPPHPPKRFSEIRKLSRKICRHFYLSDFWEEGSPVGCSRRRMESATPVDRQVGGYLCSERTLGTGASDRYFGAARTSQVPRSVARPRAIDRAVRSRVRRSGPVWLPLNCMWHIGEVGTIGDCV
jgi:hypothetical protein